MTNFTFDESGAVTVDWVVLTAGLVGLGLATMSVVSSGVEDVSKDVGSELSGTLIYTSFETRNNSAFYEVFCALKGFLGRFVPRRSRRRWLLARSRRIF